MTKSEIVKRLQTIRDIMQKGDLFYADAEVMTAAIEAINAPDTGKLYTAFDVIKLVQAAVSDAVCGMGAEESAVTAYEIERDIVSRLVGGDSSERESRGLATGRRRNVELQITTASNNSTGLKSCREEQNHDDQTGD